ncbi:MAG: hypothetical protein ACRDMV_12465 [Streptosporangiales bacterium]
MPTTSVYGWRYPEDGDEPNPNQIQHLGEDIEQTVKDLITDTGDRTDLAVTMGSGWTLQQLNYRIILGKFMTLHVQATRSGADIQAQSNGDGHPGNITDSDVLTIDDTAKRPTSDSESNVHTTTTSGAARLKIGGTLTIYDLHTNSTIAKDDLVSFTFLYFTP